MDEPRPWSGQAALLRQVAGALGIGVGEVSELDPLWDALDDHSDVLERVGRGDRSLDLGAVRGRDRRDGR